MVVCPAADWRSTGNVKPSDPQSSSDVIRCLKRLSDLKLLDLSARLELERLERIVLPCSLLFGRLLLSLCCLRHPFGHQVRGNVFELRSNERLVLKDNVVTEHLQVHRVVFKVFLESLRCEELGDNLALPCPLDGDARNSAEHLFDAVTQALNGPHLELVWGDGLAVPFAQEFFGGSKRLCVKLGHKAQRQPSLCASGSPANAVHIRHGRWWQIKVDHVADILKIYASRNAILRIRILRFSFARRNFLILPFAKHCGECQEFETRSWRQKIALAITKPHTLGFVRGDDDVIDVLVKLRQNVVARCNR
eukprot:m.648686 g.648686  ORF g.648686 m.648686 type:complete len:307 (-) comp58387_c0_seq32:1127-2047(-)